MLVAVLLAAGSGFAAADKIGVGVGTGRIQLKEDLKPGLTYSLPSIAVFNNGDVASDYAMSVQFNEKQPQMKPKAEWVHFSPQKFRLEPSKARTVSVTLRASSSARPGSYFAYIEAHPLKKDVSGETAINIAAATKLSFEVAPANFLQKIYYFLLDLWNKYRPIIIMILILLAAAVLITFARRHLNIEISKKPKQNSN